MKKGIVAVLGCICMMFICAACGFDSGPIEKELNSCTWYTDKYDKDDHVIAYQYVFKEGKVNVSCFDITDASAGEGSTMNTDESAFDIQKLGEFEYAINEEAIVIQGEEEETIPYTFEDETLRLDNGKFFTEGQIQTHLKGKWVWTYETVFAGISAKFTNTNDYDGKGNVESTLIGIGIESASITNKGTYTINNGYLIETIENGEVRCYYFSYDGKDIKFLNIDQVKQ